ncbi:lactobacillus shifted protein [Rhizoctonia solani]|uniref:Lactobacillus shifted protein n=1 Tax=Rhizoctonia solani TaxID=456999 RepID=A0A8H8NUH5_9AGAM|nr:lactobacillus shifted protein [Rhizoctonia solani]QRW18885.1 lactobacillus shifted protein [Rhizoctonia solani]
MVHQTNRAATHSDIYQFPAQRFDDAGPSCTHAPRGPTTKQPGTGLPQAPNRDKPWSASQRPRPGPESNARFEQTDLSLQPTPLSAQALIEKEPIRVVHGRRAVCDGGGGPLGHPKIFINLDKPGPRPCGYCGVRFEQAPHHGHEH